MTTARLLEGSGEVAPKRWANSLRWFASAIESNSARRLELFNRIELEDFIAASAQIARNRGMTKDGGDRARACPPASASPTPRQFRRLGAARVSSAASRDGKHHAEEEKQHEQHDNQRS